MEMHERCDAEAPTAAPTEAPTAPPTAAPTEAPKADIWGHPKGTESIGAEASPAWSAKKVCPLVGCFSRWAIKLLVCGDVIMIC